MNSPAESLASDGIGPISRMELLISYALRAGVLLSASIILLGVVLLALTHHTGYAPILPHHLANILAFHSTGGPGVFPTAPAAVAQGTLAGKPYAIIGLGTLLLIATPVVRVALSVAFFLVDRDWLYMCTTVLVLAVLLLSPGGGPRPGR